MQLKKTVLSLFFLTSFLTTFGIQLHHSIEDHSYAICSAHDVEHICNHDVQSFQDFTYNPLFTTFSNTFQLIQVITIENDKIAKPEFVQTQTSLPFSLRGPPSLSE